MLPRMTKKASRSNASETVAFGLTVALKAVFAVNPEGLAHTKMLLGIGEVESFRA